MYATKNSGNEIVVNVAVFTDLSKNELRYRAVRIPRINDKGTAIRAAIEAKNSVFHNLGAILSTTSADLSAPEALRPEKEVPRSPCIAPSAQSKYLIYAGLSSPSSARKAATVSGNAA